jgi:hypothetical protein
MTASSCCARSNALGSPHAAPSPHAAAIRTPRPRSTCWRPRSPSCSASRSKTPFACSTDLSSLASSARSPTAQNGGSTGSPTSPVACGHNRAARGGRGPLSSNPWPRPLVNRRRRWSPHRYCPYANGGNSTSATSTGCSTAPIRLSAAPNGCLNNSEIV